MCLKFVGEHELSAENAMMVKMAESWFEILWRFVPEGVCVVHGEGGCRIEWSCSSSHTDLPLTVMALKM